jgi:allantoinase
LAFPAVDETGFAVAAESCALAGRPLLLHAEDPQVLREAKSRLAEEARSAQHDTPEAQSSTQSSAQSSAALRNADPGLDWRRYYAQRPMEAEIEACRKAIDAAGGHASSVHIVHVGTAEAARMVRRSGASCETCAHYLAFDEQDYSVYGAALKTAPPVKEASQKALLWKLLADGSIDFVTSDHAGAPEYEKFTGNPETAYGGIPGTGTLFPYLLSEGFFARRLTLKRFLEASSGAAARRYGLSGGKGSIEKGKDADFVLVDPGLTTLLEPSVMLSKSRVSPFSGMRLAGKILGTFVRGRLVHGVPGFFPHDISGDPADLPGFAGSASGSGHIFAPPGSGQFLQWGYRWEK